MKNNIKSRRSGWKDSVFSILAIVALVTGPFVSTGALTENVFAQAAPECTPNAPQVIVSDVATQVGGNGAVAVTPHTAWDDYDPLPSGAVWIWDAEKVPADDTGSNPAGTLTFTSDFSITGTPTGASLEITADNSYVATVNGNAVGTDADWQTVETYPIAAGNLLSGLNTLTIVATNDGPDGPGNPAGLIYRLTVDSETCPPPTGSIEITKYACPTDTIVTRSVNGVGGAVPAGCSLQSGETFGYVHGSSTDTAGPYPELPANGGVITEGGTTDGVGVLTIGDLSPDGRYLIVETDGSGNQLPTGDILGLYCQGDGDTSGTNDNQELTFVTAGQTAECVAYNEEATLDFAKVHIYKYIGATQVPDDSTLAPFPMHASWVTTNFPSGEGDYVLGNSHGGAAFRYAADTSPMQTPVASYNTYENTDGSVVLPIGTECAPDKFRLVGYKSGDSLVAAQGATLSTTAPTYTDFSADKYLIVVNESCNDVADNFCSVEVVSDATNTIVENGDDNATTTYSGHPSWTALIPGATWIWESFYVVDPLVDTTRTFEKTFTVEDVNNATLSIATDNSYRVFINGDEVVIPTQGNEDNYQLANQDNGINVMSFIDENAENTIRVEVKNWALANSTSETNPAGALYKLVINEGSENGVCEQPPADNDVSDVTVCKYANSINSENLLDGWTVSLDGDGNDYSDVTGESENGRQTGCVTFDNVPYGSYTLNEELQVGWENLTGVEGATNAGAQVAVNESTETFNLVNAMVCDPQTNLMLNGSFENPNVTHVDAWDIFPSGTSGLDWAVSWAGPFVGAPLTANAELHRGVNGWLANNGVQYTELDSDWNGHAVGGPEGEQASVILSQAVSTIPGRTYSLSYAFSPRPGTAAAQNSLEASADGNVLNTITNTDGSANANTVWMTHTHSFVAGSTSTDIAFKDLGAPNGEGTFLDDVRLYCVPRVPPQDEETSETVIVRPSDLTFDFAAPGIKDWYFWDDVNDTPSTTEVAGEYEFVTGPGAPTLPVGSVQMSVNGTERWNIATFQFEGVDLSDIGAMSFDTYQPNTNPGSNEAIYLNFDVDFNNATTTGYQGRLVFVPADQGAVAEGAWENHNAFGAGLWRWSAYAGGTFNTNAGATPGMWPDASSTEVRAWNDIVAAFPNAEIFNEGAYGGQLLFRAGEPYPAGFTGAVDNFVIKVLNHTTTYNFEPEIPVVTNGGGETIRSGGGGGGDGSNGLGQTDDNSVSGGSVLGASTAPGEVLGNQIALLPTGAPNTGSGGAAQGGLYGALLMISGLYGIIRSRKTRI